MFASALVLTSVFTYNVQEIDARASTWGLQFPMLHLYYCSIFLPTLTYAVGAWSDLVGVRQKNSLFSIQRFMLIRLTKAYRTTSTEALQISASILPLDFELVKRRAIYIRKASEK